MQVRNLGSQGLRVPAIGLGCMGMSTAYGERDDESSTRAIHRAIERGAGFLDTSDAYGNGVNEELVGKAIAGKRDQVILASKFGNIRLPDGGREIVGRPDYVPQACDASLKRLGVEHIDLYYQHRSRAKRGRAGNHPPGQRHPSHLGAAIGIFALVPRPGGRCAAGLP
jgi:aryl-alcohol dehydrogenase-like predicted oxidoreductase